jgi:VIT1/CCC1 family predicted Fe2+/Mn2+ transporter
MSTGQPAGPPVLPDHHNADVSGGWLRAAVFGAMDGLVTNIALIAGVGGGGMSARNVLLAGAAGLVAGAISMAFGEYASVRTQNEQIAREVAKERAELSRNPHGEAQELAELWIGRGLPAEAARAMAEALKERPEEALRIHVQEELGVSATESPSPWVAAGSSFACFSVGALIPLLPYLLGFGHLGLALGVGGLGLIAVGALAARFTGRPWWLGAGRQLLLGAVAAGVTYLIGSAIGVGVA